MGSAKGPDPVGSASKNLPLGMEIPFCFFVLTTPNLPQKGRCDGEVFAFNLNSIRILYIMRHSVIDCDGSRIRWGCPAVALLQFGGNERSHRASGLWRKRVPGGSKEV